MERCGQFEPTCEHDDCAESMRKWISPIEYERGSIRALLIKHLELFCAESRLASIPNLSLESIHLFVQSLEVGQMFHSRILPERHLFSTIGFECHTLHITHVAVHAFPCAFENFDREAFPRVVVTCTVFGTFDERIGLATDELIEEFEVVGDDHIETRAIKHVIQPQTSHEEELSRKQDSARGSKVRDPLAQMCNFRHDRIVVRLDDVEEDLVGTQRIELTDLKLGIRIAMFLELHTEKIKEDSTNLLQSVQFGPLGDHCDWMLSDDSLDHQHDRMVSIVDHPFAVLEILFARRNKVTEVDSMEQQCLLRQQFARRAFKTVPDVRYNLESRFAPDCEISQNIINFHQFLLWEG